MFEGVKNLRIQLLSHQVDHHFVALVEVEGAVWELDGRRKSGAKLVGNFFLALAVILLKSTSREMLQF